MTRKTHPLTSRPAHKGLRKRQVYPLCILLLIALVSVAEQVAGYTLIVHPTNPVSQLPKGQVSKLFLKKLTRWEDGRSVQPIDLVETSPVRERFSKAIHNKRVSAIKSYWEQMIFSGKAAPPPEVSSDQDVIRYVKEHPAAIGYINGTNPPPDVKTFKITDD